MNGIQIVTKALSPATLCIGFASVCAGCAASSIHGYFDFFPSLLCLIFIMLVQCTDNISHRYYDEKYGYGENVRDGMMNEDDEGRPTIIILFEAMKVSLSLTITVGLAILVVAGWWTLIPVVVMILLHRLNNFGKHPWNHSILYPIISFLLFGPTCIISTCMVNLSSEHISILDWEFVEPSVILSVVFGLMAMNSHIIYRASHSLNGFNKYISITGKYGVKATSIVLGVSTVIYSVLLGLTPYLIEMSMSIAYIILPILSMLFSFYIIYLLNQKKRLNNTWTLSIFNLLFVAITIFIVFWFAGYPNFAEFNDYEIVNFL